MAAGDAPDICCAIWDTMASDETEGGRDGKSMDSPRAGGRYFIAGTAIAQLEKRDARFKARLTSWLVEQRRLGTKCPEISRTTIKDVEQKQNLSVHKRADQLLRYIENATENIGSIVAFADQNISATAMAWSESTGMDEVKSLLRHLKKRGWLEESTDEKYALTVEGYTRLEELERTDTESGQAFVAMWFHDSTDCAWEQGIKLGIKDAGYEPIRIDQEEFNNKIDDKIIAEIRRSRFVVADFTQGNDGARGGVYYEAGFAHGRDIPVIFTCRKDALDRVHFDTQQYNHIVWEKAQELREKLEARISDTIGDGPYKEK